MSELSLAQRYAIIALNAQYSNRMTNAQKVALRCIAAATVLEVYFNKGFTQTPQGLSLQKGMLNSNSVTLYQTILLEPFFLRTESVDKDLNWWLKKSSQSNHSKLKKLEKAIVDSLAGIDMIEEIPNLLGCDLYYDSAVVTINEYRSNAEEYAKITETTRAEVLEQKSVSDETIAMLWLLRESGCLHDIFSNKELEVVSTRINELYQSGPFAKLVFSINIYRGIEILIKNYLRIKKQAIKTSVGTGINFAFPVIERSQSIFIETSSWFSNSQQRLSDVKARLEAKGHYYSVLREGQVPLIKIDNIIYEVAPTAVGGEIPIQGVRLRKYPI